MYTLFHSFFIGIILFLISRYFRGPFPKWSLYLAAIVKLLSGIILGYIFFTYQNGGDTLHYFNEVSELSSSLSSISQYLVELTQGLPWFYGEGRTNLFIKIVTPLAIFTGQNYWLTGMYLSLLSFLAFWFLTRTLATNFPEYRWVAYYSFCLFPSVVFWSSGLLKEPVINSFLAISAAMILKIDRSKKFNYPTTGILLIMMVLIFLLKYYIIPALMAGIGWWVLSKFQLKLRTRLVVFFGFVILGFCSLQFLHPWLTPERLPQTIHENYLDIANRTDDSFTGIIIDPSYSSLAKNSLKGTITGLYRPFVWEEGSLFNWEYKLENITLLLLTLISLIHIKSVRWHSLATSVLIYSIILSLTITFTTPNFGTLFRYKSTFLPYFVFVVSVIPFKKYISQATGN